MSASLVKLTVVAPADLESTLIESLLEMQPPVGAFSTMNVHGHGQSFAAASTAERVSGRASRLMVVAILPPSHARTVIDHLKAHLHVAHAAWWIEPVQEFGNFQ